MYHLRCLSATLTNTVLAVCEESYAAAYNHAPSDDRAAPRIRGSKSFGGFLFKKLSN